ncbi:MAG: hypothetical protein HQ580_14070 [Planctomycetes bacterium]|nr:hypothetical protein [Planctomycetota bacterium]
MQNNSQEKNNINFDYDTFVKGIVSDKIKPATVKRQYDKEGEPFTNYDFPEFKCQVHAHFNDEQREEIGICHIKLYGSEEMLSFVDNYALSMLRHHSEEKKTESSQQNKSDEFNKLAQEKRTPLLAEFWFFLKHNKKWWLLPILIVLLLMGLLVLLGGTAIAPFIYPLF